MTDLLRIVRTERAQFLTNLAKALIVVMFVYMYKPALDVLRDKKEDCVTRACYNII